MSALNFLAEGLRFGIQYPYHSLQLSLPPFPKHLTPSSGLQGLYMHTIHIHHMQAKHSSFLKNLKGGSRPEAHKTTQTIDITLVCSPETDGKTLLLKAPQILVVGHAEINLELTKKHPPCWFVSIVWEAAM